MPPRFFYVVPTPNKDIILRLNSTVAIASPSGSSISYAPDQQDPNTPLKKETSCLPLVFHAAFGFQLFTQKEQRDREKFSSLTKLPFHRAACLPRKLPRRDLQIRIMRSTLPTPYFVYLII